MRMTWNWKLQCTLGEVTPSYINAYTCAHDLFIGGLFTLQKNIIRYGIFQNKGKCKLVLKCTLLVIMIFGGII
jgi:hypothetical protein